jgi:hypothetical protein
MKFTLCVNYVTYCRFCSIIHFNLKQMKLTLCVNYVTYLYSHVILFKINLLIFVKNKFIHN